jgi:uncharacterized protein
VKLKVQISETPAELEQGLMFRESLQKDEGMLFIFNRPRILSFWGKNTFIPLDIAFVDENDVITDINSIEPHNLKSITSTKKCLMAVECNKDFFDNHNISVGDKIDIERYKNTGELSFIKYKTAQVEKQDKSDQVVGKPIDNSATIQQTTSLPTIDTSDLSNFLEDDIEDQEEQKKDDLSQEVENEETPVNENIEETTEPVEEVVEETEIPEIKPPVYPIFSNVFEATEWAEKNLEVIRINYITKRGRQLVRDIEPHGTFHSQSTMREILVTYDETVYNIRAFIMTNIKNWSFVGKKFQKKFNVR